EEQLIGARDDVTQDLNKRNKNDFVLWFTKSKFEDQALKWDSPWGVGYPGWHIECSCISMKHLGEYMDIHCGGVDNIFPHHTNEIAQSEAFLGHKWCNYWFHVHHLNDRNGKMSKSKGAFLTVSYLEEQGYDPLLYRFFCLQSHYRKPLEFSFEALDNAKAAYDKLKNRITAIAEEAVTAGKAVLEPSAGQDGVRIYKVNENAADSAVFDEYKAKFIEALSADINTSMAITVLMEALKADTDAATKLALVGSFDEVLGLGLLTVKEEAGNGVDPEFEKYICGQIELRTAAKKEKNYAEADRIRQELLEKGVVLEDTREGVKWHLK
ncbi:MAG: cysteine--tRNA ligase, partial [Lachnospiraceae bacterium]|nr:cysteine--tRNA ligase [Lachnospiraceae bacterium]